jgi:hypothetical protein
MALEAALERDALLAAHRQQMKASKLAKRLARAEADDAASEAAEAEKIAAVAYLTAGSGGGGGGGGTSTPRSTTSPERAHSALESVDGDDPGMGAAWTKTDCVMEMRKQFYRLLASQATPLVCEPDVALRRHTQPPEPMVPGVGSGTVPTSPMLHPPMHTKHVVADVCGVH